VRFQPSRYSRPYGDAASDAAGAAAGEAAKEAGSGANPYLAAADGLFTSVTSVFSFLGAKQASKASQAASLASSQATLAQAASATEQARLAAQQGTESRATTLKVVNMLIPATFGIVMLFIAGKFVLAADLSGDADEEE